MNTTQVWISYYEQEKVIQQMLARLDRLEKGFQELATPEQVAFESRVARSGLCHCRDCEARRKGISA